MLSVGRKTADEIADGLIGAKRTGAQMLEIDSFGRIDLAAVIKRLLRPARLVEHGHPAIGENETCGDVVGLVASGETVHAQTGLEPLHIHELLAVVLQREFEIHFIASCPDLMHHVDVWLHRIPQLEPLPVLLRRHPLGLVRDRRPLPVPVRRAAATKGFEIPDLHLPAGHVWPGNCQHVVGPADSEAGVCVRQRQVKSQQYHQSIPVPDPTNPAWELPIIRLWGSLLLVKCGAGPGERSSTETHVIYPGTSGSRGSVLECAGLPALSIGPATFQKRQRTGAL